MGAPQIFSPAASAFSSIADEMQAMLTEREAKRLALAKQAALDKQQAFNNDITTRETVVKERADKATYHAPTTVQHVLGADGKNYTRIYHADGRVENVPEAAPLKSPTESDGSDYHQFLGRYATGLHKTVDTLTDAEELDARKKYGQSDDRPQLPFVIVNGPNGPMTVDRGNSTARPVTDANNPGVPIGPPLTSDQRSKELQAQLTDDSLGEIQRLYKDEYVGPLGGRAYGLREKGPEHMGVIDKVLPLNRDRSEFTAALARNRNRLINLITGAAVGKDEERRILGEAPDEAQAPTVFAARMAQTQKNIDMLLARIADMRSHSPTTPARMGGPGRAGGGGAIDRRVRRWVIGPDGQGHLE